MKNSTKLKIGGFATAIPVGLACAHLTLEYGVQGAQLILVIAIVGASFLAGHFFGEANAIEVHLEPNKETGGDPDGKPSGKSPI